MGCHRDVFSRPFHGLVNSFRTGDPTDESVGYSPSSAARTDVGGVLLMVAGTEIGGEARFKFGGRVAP